MSKLDNGLIEKEYSRYYASDVKRRVGLVYICRHARIYVHFYMPSRRLRT